MISRVVVRGIAAATRLASRSSGLLTIPQYNFARKQDAGATNFISVIEEEIQAEEGNKTDLSEHISNFEQKGWKLSKDNVQVELSKTIGKYQVRLLSNIKSPSNFEDNEENKQLQGQQEGEEDYQGEMNEVTVCVTKQGNSKTMVVHVIVTQGFEITSVNFAPSYQDAKKNRMDIFTSNAYTGPEMESLSDQLFEGIYTFLEQDCEVTDELLEGFGDYCIDAEQGFYIEWLKDIKSLL